MSGLEQPTREQGRDWAERELADPRYRDVDVSIFGKIWRAIIRFLDKLIGSVTGSESPWYIIGVIAATAIFVGLVIWRVKSGADSDFSAALFQKQQGFSGTDPDVFRKKATAAAELSDWPNATADMIRAVFAQLHAKRFIDVEAASTASELATAGAIAVPAIAGELRSAAVLFDRVIFGDYEASEADFRFAQELDRAAQQLRSAAETADDADNTSAQEQVVS